MSKRNDYISWSQYFMEIAKLSAKRSKDPSTQVGACIVNAENKIVGIGYNGFPNGIDDNQLSWSRDGDYLDTKYPYVCHAEMNAILAAKRPVTGNTLYTFPLLPCTNCASVCIQAGIRRVVSQSCVDNRWKSNIEESKELFKKAGVEVIELF